MGPDLLGVAWATAFLLAVLGLFALIDRIVCGAWEALNGSPGWALVAGMSAWAGKASTEDASTPPTSPNGEPPTITEPVATERVSHPRVRGGASAFAIC